MGGGLLQKVNRDTMSFATKLSFIEYADGSQRDVMKLPKTDAGKVSLPGILRVKRDPNTGLELVYPRNPSDNSYDSTDILRVVYDGKPIPNVWDDFDTIRKRVQEQWTKSPKVHDNISAELKAKTNDWIQKQRKLLEDDKL
jgi:nicotinamide phosphoribosyltransferase